MVAVLIGVATWVSAANGTGMFGVGGAVGAATAAYAGQNGRPGIFTDAVNASHPVPITVEITFEYFASCGVAFGAFARISGWIGGPSSWPAEATGPATTIPTMVA